MLGMMRKALIGRWRFGTIAIDNKPFQLSIWI